MATYKKETSRINITYLDGETKKKLFEIKDRDWMNMGEIFADHHASDIISRAFPKGDCPKNIIIMASVVLYKIEEE